MFDVVVTVSRSDNRPTTSIWSVDLLDRLPVIPIPLLPGDDDILLDLQQIQEQVYQESAYRRRLDYSSAIPAPELPSAKKTRFQSWIDQVNA